MEHPRLALFLSTSLFLAACDDGDVDPDDGDGLAHAFVDLDGVTLHYVVAGAGDPVLLLPGWPETWHEWRHVIAELSLDHTVIAVDLRGMGDSSKPSDGYDKMTLANDVHGLVEHLGYDRISVVGHDIGGMVAYAYARSHPDIVERVAIIEAPIPSPQFYQYPALSPQGGVWWFGFHALSELAERMVTGREDVYFDWFFDNLTAYPDAITPEDRRIYVEAARTDGGLRAGFEYYRTFDQDIAANAMLDEPLAAPVLAIGGAYAIGEGQGAMLEPLATDLTARVIDCGHFIPEEQPEALAAELTSFLGGS